MSSSLASVGLIPACAGRAGEVDGAVESEAAHPRMRGEGSQIITNATNSGGSSPHARGGRGGPENAGVGERLIPACAGRALGPARRRPRCGAHPRMRGEGRQHLRSNEGENGSSPHARGGRVAYVADRFGNRLIPACAGRARGPSPGRGSPGAHPRMRGEGADSIIRKPAEPGSSPHARGGLLLARVLPRALRLIPACAGRARSRKIGTTSGSAHPRMRGEGHELGAAGTNLPGSSPHARGGPRAAHGSRIAPRLIPACAGRASPSRRCSAARWAHPRMRGEGSRPAHHERRHSGSSPHARGGLFHEGRANGESGLIPACAGRACPLVTTSAASSAHPRMRGEGRERRTVPESRRGSSPHARGGPPGYPSTRAG